MQGAFFLPCRKRSLTREAPTPTNISTKSEPRDGEEGHARLRRPRRGPAGSCRCPADRSAARPWGCAPPSRVNFLGSRRKAMISSSSIFDSSTPATSSKVMRCWFSVRSRALDLPKLMALPPPACIWRMKKIHRPMISSSGNHMIRIWRQKPASGLGRAVTLCTLSWRLATSSSPHHRGVAGELAAVRALAGDQVLLDHHGFDRTALHLGQEIAVGQGRGGLVGLTQQAHEQQDHDQDDHPESHVAVLIVHCRSPGRVRKPL